MRLTKEVAQWILYEVRSNRWIQVLLTYLVSINFLLLFILTRRDYTAATIGSVIFIPLLFTVLVTVPTLFYWWNQRKECTQYRFDRELKIMASYKEITLIKAAKVFLSSVHA